MTAYLAGSGMRRSILVGLLGQGIKPSLTPEMHEREAERKRLRYVYKTVDLHGERLERRHIQPLLEFAVELGFDGLNITHPLKRAMVPLMERVTGDVAAIGALNTVLIRDGATIGHNTDVTGFARAFAEGIPDADLDSVVLLGAGGAGTAVAHALVGLGAQRVHVFDPDDARPRALARSVARSHPDATVEAVADAGLGDVVAGASGLVNATPVGMAQHPGIPLAPNLLRADLWVTDIVYRPLVTDLLQAARAAGCKTLSGAGMAVHQAADAFELIAGLPADREAMVRDFDSMVSAEVGRSRAPDPENPEEGSSNVS